MNILDSIVWGEETEALRRRLPPRCPPSPRPVPGVRSAAGRGGASFFFFLKDINSSRVVCEGSQRRLTL